MRNGSPLGRPSVFSASTSIMLPPLPSTRSVAIAASRRRWTPPPQQWHIAPALQRRPGSLTKPAMTRPLPLLLFLCLGAAVILLYGGTEAGAAAAPARAEWKAVLIAGDNAEPVFDNAVDAVAHWLAGHGVARDDIHRLSAQLQSRDPSVEPATAQRVLYRIANLDARPGERCLIFITSHGGREEGVWLAYGGEFLTPSELAHAVAQGCGAVPSVVIVSSCYS